MSRLSLRKLSALAATTVTAFTIIAQLAIAAPLPRPFFGCQPAGTNCWLGVVGGNCDNSCDCVFLDGSQNSNNAYCTIN